MSNGQETTTEESNEKKLHPAILTQENWGGDSVIGMVGKSTKVLSISRVVTLYATERPHDRALTCGDETLSWGELDRSTNRLARALAEKGVRRGVLVTIALPNSIAFWQTTIAIWKLGATPQLLSTNLPGRELEEVIEIADSALVVVETSDERVANRTSVPISFVKKATADLSLSDKLLPDVISPKWKAPTSGGSTGLPKIIISAYPGLFPFDLNPLNFPIRSHCVLPGPLHHNGAFSFSAFCLFLGNHVINFPRFEPEKVLDAVATFRPKLLYLVPTMMNRLWKLDDEVKRVADMSCLQLVFHTASPCPPWLKEGWIRWMSRPDVLCELYGSTESQAFTWITGSEWLEHRGSVGKPISGKMKVVGEDGNDLPPGGTSIGEIYVLADHGRNSTYEYLGGEARRLGDTDWESLGDTGYIDEDGYVYIVDRRKDQIILHGGDNKTGSKVYPAVVEAALEEHSAVRSCAVIGVSEGDLGQRVHAVVDCVPGSAVDESALRAHMAERLVGYKCPSTYEFVNLPVRDDAGKVRRSRLSAERT